MQQDPSLAVFHNRARSGNDGIWLGSTGVVVMLNSPVAHCAVSTSRISVADLQTASKSLALGESTLGRVLEDCQDDPAITAGGRLVGAPWCGRTPSSPCPPRIASTVGPPSSLAWPNWRASTGCCWASAWAGRSL